MTVTTVNVPFRVVISRQELIDVFRGVIPYEEWKYHVLNFFTDVPQTTMKRFMDENGLSLEQMEKVHAQLPAFYQNGHFRQIVNESMGKPL